MLNCARQARRIRTGQGGASAPRVHADLAHVCDLVLCRPSTKPLEVPVDRSDCECAEICMSIIDRRDARARVVTRPRANAISMPGSDNITTAVICAPARHGADTEPMACSINTSVARHRGATSCRYVGVADCPVARPAATAVYRRACPAFSTGSALCLWSVRGLSCGSPFVARWWTCGSSQDQKDHHRDPSGSSITDAVRLSCSCR